MKIYAIYLPLTFHWYDEIQAGRKKIEYRETSEYWRKRIWLKRFDLSHVQFRRGYSEVTTVREIMRIDIGLCPYPEWDGVYYRIHFQ